MNLDSVGKGLVAAGLIAAFVSHYSTWDGSFWSHANATPAPVATISGAVKLGVSGRLVIQSLPDFVSIADKPAVGTLVIQR